MLCMRVSGRVGLETVMESKFGLMERSMRETGKITGRMGKADSLI